MSVRDSLFTSSSGQVMYLPEHDIRSDLGFDPHSAPPQTTENPLAFNKVVWIDHERRVIYYYDKNGQLDEKPFQGAHKATEQEIRSIMETRLPRAEKIRSNKFGPLTAKDANGVVVATFDHKNDGNVEYDFREGAPNPKADEVGDLAPSLPEDKEEDGTHLDDLYDPDSLGGTPAFCYATNAKLRSYADAWVAQIDRNFDPTRKSEAPQVDFFTGRMWDCKCYIALKAAQQEAKNYSDMVKAFKEKSKAFLGAKVTDAPRVPHIEWKFFPHQAKVLAMLDKAPHAMVGVAAGGGKCLGKNTKVLRYDGKIVKVQHIQKGDLLMGPDSKPRKVLSTTKGKGKLFRIVPTKGKSWVCNDVHILTLVRSGVHGNDGTPFDMPLNEFLEQTRAFRNSCKLFAPPDGVDFAKAEKLPLDPYFLGVWLGDGTKALTGVSVSKPDKEIEQICRKMAKKFDLTVRVSNEDLEESDGRCPTYHIKGAKGSSNPLLDLLRNLMGDGGKIPHSYLTASRKDRLELLAGLLDTDGHLHNGSYEITQKEKGYAEGVCFLARSVGMRALISPKEVGGTTYWRVSISGETSTIPLRIPRKQAAPRRQKIVATRTGFKVEAEGNGYYYGFELDGDGRFLLGDFIVTHNTLISVADILNYIQTKRAKRGCIVMPGDGLVAQQKQEIQEFTGGTVNVICLTSDVVRRYCPKTEDDRYDLEPLRKMIVKSPPNTIILATYSFFTQDKIKTATKGKFRFPRAYWLAVKCGVDMVNIDECFPGDTHVMIDYDRSMSMHDIMESPDVTHVLSYDLEAKKIVKKKIVKKIISGAETGSLTRLTIRDDKGELQTLRMTHKHKIWSATRKAMVCAEDLEVGERLIKYDGAFSAYRKCEHCDEIVAKDRQNGSYDRPYTAHVLSEHKDLLNGEFVCASCQKICATSKGLGMHIRTQHESHKDSARREKIRSARNIFWADPKKAAKARKAISAANTGDGNGSKRPEVRAKIGASRRAAWQAMPKAKRDAAVKRFIEVPLHRNLPNRIEKTVISWSVEGLKFVGDGQLFMTLTNSKGVQKHKNPDFVYKERGKVQKIVEVMDFEHWHTRREARSIVSQYAKLGYPCLIVDAKRVKSEPDVVRGEIEAFVNNHYVTVEAVERTPYRQEFVYNLHVAGTHNYFAVSKEGMPLLVSNCHKIKNDSDTSNAMLQLGEKVPVRRAMSGTLVANNLKDIHRPGVFVDASILGDIDSFCERYAEVYEVKGDTASVKKWKPGAAKAIRARLMTTCGVQVSRSHWMYMLPKFHKRYHKVKLSPAQNAAYQRIVNDTMRELEEGVEIVYDSDGKEIGTKPNAMLAKLWKEYQDLKPEDKEGDEEVSPMLLAKLSKFDQYVGCPIIDPFTWRKLPKEDKISPKVKMLDKILDEHFSMIPAMKKAVDAAWKKAGSPPGKGWNNNMGKVIVFSTFQDVAYHLQQQSKYRAQSVYYDAGHKIVLEDFKTDPKIKVIFAVEQSMREGHNLQMAARIIRVNVPWNPGDIEQTKARTYRAGNVHPEVYEDVIICDGSAEVAKAARLVMKMHNNAKLQSDFDDTHELEPIFMNKDTLRGFTDFDKHLSSYLPLEESIQKFDEDEADRLKAVNGTVKLKLGNGKKLDGSKTIVTPFVKGDPEEKAAPREKPTPRTVSDREATPHGAVTPVEILVRSYWPGDISLIVRSDTNNHPKLRRLKGAYEDNVFVFRCDTAGEAEWMVKAHASVGIGLLPPSPAKNWTQWAAKNLPKGKTITAKLPGREKLDAKKPKYGSLELDTFKIGNRFYFYLWVGDEVTPTNKPVLKKVQLNGNTWKLLVQAGYHFQELTNKKKLFELARSLREAGYVVANGPEFEKMVDKFFPGAGATATSLLTAEEAEEEESEEEKPKKKVRKALTWRV
jgi:intein/homing endonuclease